MAGENTNNPAFESDHLDRVLRTTNALLEAHYRRNLADSDAAIEPALLNAGLQTLSLRYVLHHVESRLYRTLDAEVHRPRGWSTAGNRVLYLLLACGPLRQTELAKYTSVSAVSISRTVATLERDGYVTRSSAKDRRSRPLLLTSAGEQAVRETFSTEIERIDDYFGNLDPEERVTLLKLLSKV